MNALKKLIIQVTGLARKLHLEEPCPVEVQLINEDKAPLLVNARMAVGYRDTLSRELYVDLVDIESGLPAEIMVVDYKREFSPKSDYVELHPGHSVGSSFDLFKWYRPIRAGNYRMVVYYQADEPLASAPINVVHGVFSSEPMDLKILP